MSELPNFASDAASVSRFGHYWRGRNEIVARHAEIQFTHVAARDRGRWLIRAAHNVAVAIPQTGELVVEP